MLAAVLKRSFYFEDKPSEFMVRIIVYHAALPLS